MVKDIDKINEADDLVEELINESARLDKLIAIADENRLNLIKKLVAYPTLETLLPRAYRTFNRYEMQIPTDKEDLEVLESYLKQLFDENDISITSIISIGDVKTDYDIYFKSRDKEWVLNVPIISKMTLVNQSTLGKLKLWQMKYKHYKEVCLSYDEEVIQKAFKGN